MFYTELKITYSRTIVDPEQPKNTVFVSAGLTASLGPEDNIEAVATKVRADVTDIVRAKMEEARRKPKKDIKEAPDGSDSTPVA